MKSLWKRSVKAIAGKEPKKEEKKSHIPREEELTPDGKLKVSKTRKLPKNFAQKVLDLELKLDSGRFDLVSIDKLMQLYSVSITIV